MSFLSLSSSRSLGGLGRMLMMQKSLRCRTCSCSLRPPSPQPALRLSPRLWQPVWTWLSPAPPPAAPPASARATAALVSRTTQTTMIRPVSPPAVVVEVLQDVLKNIFNQAVLHIKRTFQPSLVRRKRKGGFLVRMRTTQGRKLLNRRRLKGRWRLDIGVTK